MPQGYRRFGLGFTLDFDNRASRGLAGARKEVRGLKGDAKSMADSFTKQIDRIEKRLDRHRRGMRTSLKATALGVGLAAAPFLLAGRQAIEASGRWGDVATLLAAQGDSFDVIDQKIARFQGRAHQVGAEIAVQTQEIESAWYQLFSALGEDQAMAGIEKVAKLSLAARGDIEAATNATVTLIDTYGKTWRHLDDAERFERVTNGLAGTVARYNTELGILREGMKDIIGPASQANIKFEETATLVGTLQTRGLTGGRAGTALKAYLRMLLQVNETASNLVKSGGGRKGTVGELLGLGSKKAINKEAQGLANLKLANATGQLRPMVDILEDIEKIFGITSETSEEAMTRIEKGALEGAEAYKAFGLSVAHMKLIQRAFSDEGSQGLLMLLGQSASIREQTRALEDSKVAENMFIARNRVAQAEVQKMKNEIYAMRVEIGNELLPATLEITSAIKDVVSWVRKFNQEHPNAMKWVVLGTSLGGTVLALAGAFGTLYFKVRMLQDLRALRMLQAQLVGATAATNTATAATARFGSAWRVASKAILPVLAAWAGWEAGKVVSKYIPGTASYNRRQALGSTSFKQFEAEFNLKTWAREESDRTGKEIGIGFGAQVADHLGPEAGAAFGESAADAYFNYEQRVADRLRESRLRGLSPEQRLAEQLGKVGDKRSFGEKIADVIVSKLTGGGGFTAPVFGGKIKTVQQFGPRDLDIGAYQSGQAGVSYKGAGTQAPFYQPTPATISITNHNIFEIPPGSTTELVKKIARELTHIDARSINSALTSEN